MAYSASPFSLWLYCTAVSMSINRWPALLQGTLAAYVQAIVHLLLTVSNAEELGQS